MAAQEFITRQSGPSLQIAFNRAVNFATEENGNDPYNGTISTCTSYKDITPEFKASGLSRLEFIDKKIHDADKRHCFVIVEKEPKRNMNKIKTTVENTVNKGTSKWELRYNIYTGWEDRQLASVRTKAEAIKIAREYTGNSKDTTFIRMEKQLIDQSPNVAIVRYKKSNEECEGSYVFFGLAAC